MNNSEFTPRADAVIEAALPQNEYDALESVDIIASGYEFDCPDCETYNTLVAIPKYGTAVECHHCHARFSVDEALDAHD